MQTQIEQTLEVLIGLPLWDGRRAADLQSFHFGDRHTVVDRKGQPCEVGTYALHLQCAWRIVGPSGIVVASRDKFYPTGDRPLEDAYDDFEWDKPGANRCDERMEAFFEQHSTAPLLVESVRADAVGGVWMRLGSDHMLEVFPDDSLEGEM